MDRTKRPHLHHPTSRISGVTSNSRFEPRGLDNIDYAYAFLDLTAFGRQEAPRHGLGSAARPMLGGAYWVAGLDKLALSPNRANVRDRRTKRRGPR